MEKIILLLLMMTGYMGAPFDDETTIKQSYCYTTDNKPYLFFSTKSAYDSLHGNLSEVSDHKDCQPLQLWALNRHGTRYPSKEEIVAFEKLNETLMKIKQNIEEGRGNLCESDYKLLSTWKWNFSIKPHMFKKLAPYGMQELKGIAQRYKNKYPMLLGQPYSKHHYYFQITKSDRTRDSYTGYIEGLFGKHTSGIFVVQSNDVIKQYKSCEVWQKQLGYNEPVVLKEYHKFELTKEYQDLINRTSKRLGFKENLEAPLIEHMYLECIFEKSWFINEPSKWCTAFEKEDLKLLEYGQDLQVYYKSGYGSEYNVKLGCAMVADLYTRLERKINGSEVEPPVTSMFTHSTAMHQFFLALNLFKDKIPPRGDNYKQQKSRKWRTSYFGLFATNLDAVLYRCPGDIQDEYKIQFLLDEVPIDITDDCDEGFCTWQSFKKKYYKTAHSCNIDFCNKKNNNY